MTSASLTEPFQKPSSLEGPPLLFIHVMKTAGTSLRRMLQDSLGMDAIYPSDHDLEGLPNGYYLSERDIVEQYHTLRPHRVLVGHFVAVLSDRLPRKHREFTFLREPLQRSLSMLRFTSQIRGITPAELIADEKFMAKAICDYQTRMFGAGDIHGPARRKPADDATLDRAIERLSRLDFLGLTERFEESCHLFDRIFGTEVAGLARRENVSSDRWDEMDSLIPHISPLIERDNILYEHAMRIFMADVSRYGVASHERRTG